jgi:hypothetical protein
MPVCGGNALHPALHPSAYYCLLSLATSLFAATEPSGFTDRQLYRSLTSPTAMAALPNNRLLIVLQNGLVTGQTWSSPQHRCGLFAFCGTDYANRHPSSERRAWTNRRPTAIASRAASARRLFFYKLQVICSSVNVRPCQLSSGTYLQSHQHN